MILAFHELVLIVDYKSLLYIHDDFVQMSIVLISPQFNLKTSLLFVEDLFNFNFEIICKRLYSFLGSDYVPIFSVWIPIKYHVTWLIVV